MFFAAPVGDVARTAARLSLPGAHRLMITLCYDAVTLLGWRVAQRNLPDSIGLTRSTIATLKSGEAEPLFTNKLTHAAGYAAVDAFVF